MLIYIIATYAIHVALMRPATGCNITLLPLRITTRNDDVTSLRQNERSLSQETKQAEVNNYPPLGGGRHLYYTNCWCNTRANVTGDLPMLLQLLLYFSIYIGYNLCGPEVPRLAYCPL